MCAVHCAAIAGNEEILRLLHEKGGVYENWRGKGFVCINGEELEVLMSTVCEWMCSSEINVDGRG